MLMLLIAWISSAIVALMILREGSKAASGALLLAMLATIIVAYLFGDVMPIFVVVCTSILAALLRTTRSWSIVLTAAPFLIGIVAGLLLLFGREYLLQMLAVLIENFETLQEQMATVAEDAGQDSNAAFDLYLLQARAIKVESFAGGYASILLFQTLLSLITARWWQAKLYNPGGFRQEFHQLRFSRGHVLLLVGVLVVVSSTTLYREWARLFLIPLMFGGIALAHGLVGIKKLSGHWLVGFYLLLMIFSPVVSMIAIIDSAVDFRGRLARSKL